MDTAIDKVRERTRKSVDERRGSDESVSANRLSSLLERGARKLKRKEKDHENNNGASTLAVNHSGESGELAFSDGGRSEGSLLDEDGHSSLLTDDGSDNEGYVQTFHNLRILPIPQSIFTSPKAYRCVIICMRVSIGIPSRQHLR